jgi:hypothetical protein
MIFSLRPACDMVHTGEFVPLPEICVSKADEHNNLSQNSILQQQLRIFITRNSFKNAFQPKSSNSQQIQNLLKNLPDRVKTLLPIANYRNSEVPFIFLLSLLVWAVKTPENRFYAGL